MKTHKEGSLIPACTRWLAAAALPLVLSGCVIWNNSNEAAEVLYPEQQEAERERDARMGSVRTEVNGAIRVDQTKGGKFTGVTEWHYPNGYVSDGPKFDKDWKKKKPPPDYSTGIDYFNSSGSSGSGGATSGSVITPKF